MKQNGRVQYWSRSNGWCYSVFESDLNGFIIEWLEYQPSSLRYRWFEDGVSVPLPACSDRI